MKPGKLDRLVTLQSLATGRGEVGGKTETWSAFATDIYAAIQDASGSQLYQAQATGNKVDKVVTIRYRPGVVAAMRCLLPSISPPAKITARINWVKEVGRREWLELYCEVINE